MNVNVQKNLFVALILLQTDGSALDLEKLEPFGISASDFYVNDICVFFNRAFLAIPRSLCKNNVTHPTLVEIPWKEQFNIILKSRFSKPIEEQIWAKCEDLQNAVSLAKEGVKSKLWILDKGNEFCPAKIMAYNMIQNMFLEEETIELAQIDPRGLNTIVIENATTLGYHRAFVANSGENKILVCYLKNLVCQEVSLLERSDPTLTINIDFLSLSKTDSTMYMTGTFSMEVFSIDTQTISEEYNNDEQNENGTTIKEIKLCGEKLEPSSGLETDFKNGLMYFLLRDYAIVRWMTTKPMVAENHDVLAQSYKRLPYVSRIFSDSQGTVFALVNPFGPHNCPNGTTDTEELQDPLQERAVPIMKYSRILDKFF